MTLTAAHHNAALLPTLPRAERNRILALAAEAAAPEYEADLARPVAERELTAFTALDGEPFLEDGYYGSPGLETPGLEIRVF